ncbi:MAG: T9SS type A sorting domain-containing protein, partial [Candidatus Cloacimonadota bacterium]|nr:T9SS type A sorting domain-containing protein [Candidatus Cloacimonadota bacterium]
KMTKKAIFFLILLVMIILQINSIEIEYENTWSRFTLYNKGIDSHNNKLYVNTYFSIEIYNILSNGDLELDYIHEVNDFIQDLQIDADANMLYTLVNEHNYPEYVLKAYDICENELVFCFSTNSMYSFNDLIYPVSHYVILGQPDQLECYNKDTQQIEDITYPYQQILGSFENTLVEYDSLNTNITFYNIDDINNPTLIYQYNHELIDYSYCYVRKVDDNHCMLIDNQEIALFYIENELNIYFDSFWDFTSISRFRQPFTLVDDQLYIGNLEGENFVFDVSDYNSPVLLYEWNEDYFMYDYFVYENYLYQSKYREGIWFYDLNELPSSQYEVFGQYFPPRSTGYFDGVIYKNYPDHISKVNMETYEEELICDAPFDESWSIHKINNLLIVFSLLLLHNYNEYAIIDLNTNTILNTFEIPDRIHIIQNDRIITSHDNYVKIYEINGDSEFELLTEFVADSPYINEFDENHIWVSHTTGDFLINTIDLEIDYDFEDFFSPESDWIAKPLKYDDRLIICNVNFPNEMVIKLYDINDLSNPLLLDSKIDSSFCRYYCLDDLIIEINRLEPIVVYNKFEDSFTDPIQEIDLDTYNEWLVIDEERNRILSFSLFYCKSFLYENTGSELELIYEKSTKLSNYPNPFNPETTISFSVQNEFPENTELIVYNLKGQKVKQLINKPLSNGDYSIVWDGSDKDNKQVSSGVYFYQLKSEDKLIANGKCLLLK